MLGGKRQQAPVKKASGKKKAGGKKKTHQKKQPGGGHPHKPKPITGPMSLTPPPNPYPVTTQPMPKTLKDQIEAKLRHYARCCK